MKLNFSYISTAVEGKLAPSADREREINGFFSDSRNPEKSKLFLAIRGERVDGNSFVRGLVEQGCAAMTDREENLDLKGDVIYVPDVRDALQKLAKYYRETEISGIPVVGVTGSVGKTTTKDMIALALSANSNVFKTQGNSNSQIGTPQTVLAVEKNADYAVIELGMSYKGEMERISRCVMPDISVITNIGYSHIENLGSREAIRDEKLKISQFSKENSVLLFNGDEPLLRDIKGLKNTVYYISADNENNDCYAKDYTENDDGSTFTAVIFGKEISVKLNVFGKHFVINSLFALCCAKLLGEDLQQAADKLSEYKSDGKRQHIYDVDGHRVISDCYNASPESMAAALSVLSAAKGRRIAVLGTMLELGNEAVALHRKVGEYTDGQADVLITFGDLAKNIASASGITEKYSFGDGEKEALRDFLAGFINVGDTVLYKASNGMNLSSVIV